MDDNERASAFAEKYRELSLDTILAQLRIAQQLGQDMSYVDEILRLKNCIARIRPAGSDPVAAEDILCAVQVANEKFPGLPPEKVEDRLIRDYPDTRKAFNTLCEWSNEQVAMMSEAHISKMFHEDSTDRREFIEDMQRRTGRGIGEIERLMDELWPEKDIIHAMLLSIPVEEPQPPIPPPVPVEEPQLPIPPPVPVEESPIPPPLPVEEPQSPVPVATVEEPQSPVPVEEPQSPVPVATVEESPVPPPVPDPAPSSPARPPPPPPAVPPPPPSPPAGIVLRPTRDGLFLGERLGSGAFGDVFCATDCREHAARGEFPWALKVFKDLPALSEHEETKKHQREYICSRRVYGHPNFVEFVKYFPPDRDHGEPFPRIVMRRAYGGNLQIWLDKHRGKAVPFTLRQDMVRQLKSAVRYLHRLQIVHRDLKPANLLLLTAIGLDAEACIIQVCDFGESTLDPSTTRSYGVGTALYCPPSGKCGGDGRADSYSCGIIMYRLATGYLPFGPASFGGFPDSSQHTIVDIEEAKQADRYDRDALSRAALLPEERQCIEQFMTLDPVRRPYVRCSDDLRRAKDWQRQIAPLCLRYLKAGEVKLEAKGSRWYCGDIEGQLSPPFPMDSELARIVRAPAVAEAAAWAAPCPMERAHESRFPLGGFVFFAPGNRLVVGAAELVPMGPDSEGVVQVPLRFESPQPWHADLQFNLLNSSVESITDAGGSGRWRTVPEGFTVIASARAGRKYWLSWLFPGEVLKNAATGVVFVVSQCGALVVGERGTKGLFNNQPTVFELRGASVDDMVQQQRKDLDGADRGAVLARQHGVLSHRIGSFSELAKRKEEMNSGEDIRRFLGLSGGLDFLDEQHQREAWLQTLDSVFTPASRGQLPTFLSAGVVLAKADVWLEEGEPAFEHFVPPTVAAAVAEVLNETKQTTLPDGRLARMLLDSVKDKLYHLDRLPQLGDVDFADDCGDVLRTMSSGADDLFGDEDGKPLDAFDLHPLQRPEAPTTGDRVWSRETIAKLKNLLLGSRAGKLEKRDSRMRRCMGIQGAEVLMRYWASTCTVCAAQPCQDCTALALKVFCWTKPLLPTGDDNNLCLRGNDWTGVHKLLWPGLEDDGQEMTYLDGLTGMPAALSLLGVTGLHTGFTAPFARQVARDWLMRVPSRVLAVFMPQLLQTMETLGGSPDSDLQETLIGEDRMDRSDWGYGCALFWGQAVSGETARHGPSRDDIQRMQAVSEHVALEKQLKFIKFLDKVATECKKCPTAKAAKQQLQRMLRTCDFLPAIDNADVRSEGAYDESVHVTLPLHSETPLWAIAVDKCSVFNSATMPLKLAFRVRGRADICQIIFKGGDDLRKDQLVTQLVRIVAHAYQADTGTELHLTPYGVVPTSTDSGMMEFVQGRVLQDYIRPGVCVDSENELKILRRIADGQPRQRPAGEEPPTREQAAKEAAKDAAKLERYIASNAAYAVLSYVLGIGDRHLQNLMLAEDGRLFHIDFGFIMGEDPKIKLPLKLRPEMIDAMGGEDSPHFFKFKGCVAATFVVMKDHAGLILSVLHAMKHVKSGGCYMLTGTSTPESVAAALKQVEERLFLHVRTDEVGPLVERLIDDSLHGIRALAGMVIDDLHARAKG